jgi:hypothetical protein
MKNRDLINLINRSAAGIETILTGSGDLTEDEIQDLLDDLDAAARALEDEQ